MWCIATHLSHTCCEHGFLIAVGGLERLQLTAPAQVCKLSGVCLSCPVTIVARDRNSQLSHTQFNVPQVTADSMPHESPPASLKSSSRSGQAARRLKLRRRVSHDINDMHICLAAKATEVSCAVTYIKARRAQIHKVCLHRKTVVYGPSLLRTLSAPTSKDFLRLKTQILPCLPVLRSTRALP